MANEGRGLTVRQCARFLGRSEKTIRRYLQRGWLISRRVHGDHGDEIRIEPRSVDRLKKSLSKVSTDGPSFYDLYNLFTKAPKDTRDLVVKILTSAPEEHPAEDDHGRTFHVLRNLFGRR